MSKLTKEELLKRVERLEARLGCGDGSYSPNQRTDIDGDVWQRQTNGWAVWIEDEGKWSPNVDMLDYVEDRYGPLHHTTDADRRQVGLLFDKPNVHNHGPDQGRGLDCPEKKDENGHLRGACMNTEDTGDEPLDDRHFRLIGERNRAEIRANEAEIRATKAESMLASSSLISKAGAWDDLAQHKAFRGVWPKQNQSWLEALMERLDKLSK